MSEPILPGATLGVLGGGQLGRMFSLAAREMGYRTDVLVPDDDSPTGQIADREVRAAYENLDAVKEFASRVSVVTFEFENIPAETAATAAKYAPVRPDGSLLHTTQHRLREKRALNAAGIPTVTFEAIDTEADLSRAAANVGAPGILKTAAWGYDGKGQVRVAGVHDLPAAWDAIGRQPAVLEALAPFEREISVVGARGLDGAMAIYDPVENVHENQVLDVSVCPSDLPPEVTRRAGEIVRELLAAWDVVGVLCVEMFLLDDGELLVNEIAPRPHNSGHLTIDGHACSQFEQQVRSICGLPLGSTQRKCASAMANIMGVLWAEGEPAWAEALAIPGVALHLYGKAEPRTGRKMGHLTAVAATPAEARNRALRARAALR